MPGAIIVRDQDQDAAHSLVEFLYPTVIRIVRGNLPRRGAEEDLAHEIFVKVFETLEQFQGYRQANEKFRADLK